MLNIPREAITCRNDLTFFSLQILIFSSMRAQRLSINHPWKEHVFLRCWTTNTAIMFQGWFLYLMVAHFTMRTYGVNPEFRFNQGICLHREWVVKSDFFSRKIPFLHHACATCSEQPSNIKTMTKAFFCRKRGQARCREEGDEQGGPWNVVLSQQAEAWEQTHFQAGRHISQLKLWGSGNRGTPIGSAIKGVKKKTSIIFTHGVFQLCPRRDRNSGISTNCKFLLIEMCILFLDLS